MGISEFCDEADTATQLLKQADLALYRAKSDGRGAFRFFEPAMDLQLQHRRSLETDLRTALHLNQLDVHYQPIVDVRSQEIRGFEALIRWNHPTRGSVAPGEFVPIAEDIGLIVSLGDWVLRQACAQAHHGPQS